MKKLALLTFAVLLVAMFTVPAWAVEHQFGGYWRARAYMQRNFHGYDFNGAKEPAAAGNLSKDYSVTDTRTRLYYTAVINDNLKLVNKFEMDATWGTTGGFSGNGTSFGDVGADGLAVEVKNTYAEFNWLNSTWRVGTQGWVLARGFITNDDASGILGIIPFGNHYFAPFWVKFADSGYQGHNVNEYDVDVLGFQATFGLMEGLTIAPYFAYAMSDDANYWGNSAPVTGGDGDLGVYWIGVDLDYNTDMFGVWATAIYEGGELDKTATTSWDFSAYLFALGGNYNLGAGDVHGQFFYASGDDNPNDNDWEHFAVFAGASYAWAEIMGWGMFGDNVAPNNMLGDQIQNIYALNLGISWTFMEKHKVVLDGWYASLVEKNTHPLAAFATTRPDEDLGFEVDFRYTYPIVEGLDFDFVAAYLWTGDGIYKEGSAAQVAAGKADGIMDQANAYEIGAQLSLSF